MRHFLTAALILKALKATLWAIPVSGVFLVWMVFNPGAW